MIELIPEEQTLAIPTIKVIGVGGGGGNTINSLIESGCEHISCIAANTDSQALSQSYAHAKLQLGIKATKGLGTGANPALGKHAAQEDLDKIMEVLGPSDVVFLTAGMGGGTGSGALPVIAHALKKEEILTIAVVTTPFIFEGKKRNTVAQESIAQLRDLVDALIVIPNQRLLEIVDKKATMLDSFAIINAVLVNAVKGVTDIITKPGYINVDFADVRSIMTGMGRAIMGTGFATGANRATTAAYQAINSPLLENISIKGAHGVLLNIAGSSTMGLHEISEAAAIIYEEASEDAHIIIGTVLDENLKDEIKVTVIAAGFEKNNEASQTKCAAPSPINFNSIAHQEYQNFNNNSAPKIEPAKEIENTTHSIDNAAIDDNLDIPTFMRNKELPPE